MSCETCELWGCGLSKTASLSLNHRATMWPRFFYYYYLKITGGGNPEFTRHGNHGKSRKPSEQTKVDMHVPVCLHMRMNVNLEATRCIASDVGVA